MKKCLGKDCPNNCCSSKFLGLSKALRNTNENKFVEIKLNKDEVKRINDIYGDKYFQKIGRDYYLKLNDDNSCSAFLDGECLIYDVRPDVCKLYPYYFDPFCGICIDKNCPGDFKLHDNPEVIYKLLQKRISLFQSPNHFFFDGYDIDNNILKDITTIQKLLQEIKTFFNLEDSQSIIIPYFNGKIKEDGGISAIILASNFHFTCHTFSYKNTVFIDCLNNDADQKNILKIILKYFKTNNYDLCNNFHAEKGLFGKHLIIKNDNNYSWKTSQELIKKILEITQMQPISKLISNYINDYNYDLLQPIAESHISIHQSENQLIIDVFSCKNFAEKQILDLFDLKNSNYNLVQRGIYFK